MGDQKRERQLKIERRTNTITCNSHPISTSSKEKRFEEDSKSEMIKKLALWKSAYEVMNDTMRNRYSENQKRYSSTVLELILNLVSNRRYKILYCSSVKQFFLLSIISDCRPHSFFRKTISSIYSTLLSSAKRPSPLLKLLLTKTAQEQNTIPSYSHRKVKVAQQSCVGHTNYLISS